MINAISGGLGEELTIIRNRKGSGDFFYDGGGQAHRQRRRARGDARGTGDPLGGSPGSSCAESRRLSSGYLSVVIQGRL